MTYYIQDRISGQSAYFTYKGLVEKSYSLRLLAERDAEKAEQDSFLKVNRIDVVEISKSSRLRLENERRLKENPQN